ncbi:PLP-dependent aminotransferase family protein [Burkholderia gladioli]|uniref:MocR-like pyridoxine biosynthesis transcription factor PdxR n=2 Tax=Burkholderia gladioli TaxID=28095 RepID=UPI000CFFF03C|nr:PLP-dependent aminotransferase family protein [Burkholderia gladioli]MBU9214924.1 PLP-dependent aminotransferase family protein [Burkholderia gladioli]MDN7723238.1 PLP-dependent aminotransferase family protein [Burkholderia gladioli]PRE82219.1 PLP-dependent aminotransferase family protein [Burkholderia gladioli]
MARTARSPAVPALGPLDRAAGQLSRQLAQALRDAIRRGGLLPGEPLPATRQLAAALGLARGTVIEAFEQLVAEGFLVSRGRTGTWVAPALNLPVAAMGLRPGEVRPGRAGAVGGAAGTTGAAGIAEAAKSAEAGDSRRRAASVAGENPAGPSRLPGPAAMYAAIAADFEPLPPIPFAVSVPGGATLPDAAWRRLGNRLRARGPAAPSGYGDTRGVDALREAIAAYVRRARSVRCEAAQVIVTSGTQQGLYLAAQVLLGEGERAWVENPAYRGITAILESTGRREAIVRVPVDAEGLDVDAGLRLAPEARAAFVTPSHQYPLGMPLSVARRDALLDWARARDAWIVEDDYDSELRYAGHPFPAMQGLDPRRVVYLGTFSKILFPSLRLGYAIVPPELVAAFRGARVLMDRHPPEADQHVLAAFIGEGHLDRHIRRVRGVYAASRARLIATLDAALPPELAWREPSDQGMHLVLWLAPGLDDRRVAAAALEAGVAVRPVSPMYAPGTARAGLVLGFGGYDEAVMEAAARRLAAVIVAAAK